MKKYILILLVALFLQSHFTKAQSSVLESVTYDKAKDVTNYMVFPHGSVSLPGHWTKERYNDVAYQQWFKRVSDSTSVAVALAAKKNYEFYKKSMSDYEFVVAFYKWEAEWREKQGYTIEIVKNGQKDNFIIWRLLSKGVDNMMLYGTKNGNSYNLLISNSKLSGEYKSDFLEKLFLGN